FESTFHASRAASLSPAPLTRSRSPQSELSGIPPRFDSVSPLHCPAAQNSDAAELLPRSAAHISALDRPSPCTLLPQSRGSARSPHLVARLQTFSLLSRTSVRHRQNRRIRMATNPRRPAASSPFRRSAPAPC